VAADGYRAASGPGCREGEGFGHAFPVPVETAAGVAAARRAVEFRGHIKLGRRGNADLVGASRRDGEGVGGGRSGANRAVLVQHCAGRRGGHGRGRNGGGRHGRRRGRGRGVGRGGGRWYGRGRNGGRWDFRRHGRRLDGHRAAAAAQER